VAARSGSSIVGCHGIDWEWPAPGRAARQGHVQRDRRATDDEEPATAFGVGDHVLAVVLRRASFGFLRIGHVLAEHGAEHGAAHGAAHDCVRHGLARRRHAALEHAERGGGQFEQDFAASGDVDLDVGIGAVVAAQQTHRIRHRESEVDDGGRVDDGQRDAVATWRHRRAHEAPFGVDRQPVLRSRLRVGPTDVCRHQQMPPQRCVEHAAADHAAAPNAHDHLLGTLAIGCLLGSQRALALAVPGCTRDDAHVRLRRRLEAHDPVRVFVKPLLRIALGVTGHLRRDGHRRAGRVRQCPSGHTVAGEVLPSSCTVMATFLALASAGVAPQGVWRSTSSE
jgi:hypothetical protein